MSPHVAVEVTRSAPPGTLRAARPDPDVRRLLLQLNIWPARLSGPYVLEDGRRDWQLAIKAFGSREPVRRVETHTIDGPAGALQLRVYTPESGIAPRALIAYFHGGGFIVGDLYTAGCTCRALANRTGAVVVAVRYRLAPEHPLEAGREDCLAAVDWLAANAGELGADAAQLTVAGDSAGGTLAAAMAQACAQRGGPRLATQLLIYPATDMVSDYRSNRENARGYLLTAERLAWVRREVAKVSDLDDPRLSPLHTPDLSGVAPAVMVTAGFDPIRDEGLAYGQRLRDAGVPVLALHYPGQIHGFVSFDRVLLGARDALQRIGHAWTGIAAEPRHRASDGLLWLHPRQRWNETVVGGLVFREQLRRSWRRLSEPRRDDVRQPLRFGEDPLEDA
jgi:acetyl esterase